MAIAKMERIRLIGLVSQQDDLLNRLMKQGCVEVKEVEGADDPEYAALLTPSENSLAKFKEVETRLNSAMRILKEHAPEKKTLFTMRNDIPEKEFFSSQVWQETNAAAEKLTYLQAKIDRLKVEESGLRGDIAAYEPWKAIDVPLDSQGTREAAVIFGSLPASASMDDMERELYAAVPESQVFRALCDKEQNRFLLIYLRSREEDVSAVLRQYDYIAATFRNNDGTALQLQKQAESRIAEIASENEGYVNEIKGFKGIWQNLKICIDRCSQEIMREESKEYIVTSGSVFAMEGWVDASRKNDVDGVMAEFTCAWEYSQAEEWDDVPVLLKNPKWMEPINVVTEMYSLPAYGTIDPNPLIFFTYIFFFGFMFADVAYGIIIFLACFLIVKKYNPKGTMGYLIRLGQYLGISTAICGFFVGGFFGDVITAVNDAYIGAVLPGWLQAFCDGLLLNPMDDPMTTLIVSIVIGACHLIYGQIVHLYIGFRDGNGLDHILDVVPWWILFAGIAVTALTGSIVGIIIGVLALICTQGRHKKGFFGKLMGGITSLYDITSWLSDILSYCRLMALMLATSVIASVANTLATLMQPPVGLILFVVVFVIFHTINIGINLIGTFVHAARLHYLEFFNKFYTTGGRAFRPLNRKTKYTNIIEEEN